MTRPGLALAIAICCLHLNSQSLSSAPGLSPQTAAATAAIEHTPALSDANLPALIARVQANTATNLKLAEQYTSDELWHNRSFNKDGKLTSARSVKYENVFVEGLPYRKKVEENGKPLAGKEAVAEEKRYQAAVRERRAMTTEQKRLSLHFTWHFSLPMCCLSTLFSNRIVGYDQINGRETVIVESVPRADAKPKNDDEKSALGWKQKSWIDLSDEIIARMEAESLADANHFMKGTTIRFEYDRIAETPADGAHPERAVWLSRTFSGQLRFKLLWMSGTGITEQTWSNFKKFHVDMRLLEDTVTPVNESSANPPVPDRAHP